MNISSTATRKSAFRVFSVCLLSSFFIVLPWLEPANVMAFQGGININVNDAKVVEPTSGSIDMVFTVTLSSPATGAVSVNFTTANGSATAGTCGIGGADYTTTSGAVNFAAGEQVKTIGVPICSDAVNDPNETLVVNLSGESGATLVDNQATGTITGPQAGTVLISELRHFGPGPGNDATDEFVEIYNNTNSPITVAASDASAGYGLFMMGANCDATPILVGTIPNGTIIPARGHFLITGTGYSLANYGGTGAVTANLTFSQELPANANLGIFSTSNVAQISSVNRLDAVGFGLNTSNVCNLLREGSTHVEVSFNLASLGQHSHFRKLCDFVNGCTTPGTPKDTNTNASDFIFADANATDIVTARRLGAPGPENLASPIKRDAVMPLRLLDATKSPSVAPNQVRDLTPGDPNSAADGTLSVRRRIVNNTGGNVTRLRLRIVEFTTLPSPPGVADLRGITSTDLAVGGILDTGTCAAESGSPSPPCIVTVKGLTLETPPTQPLGGGLNSTLTVTLGTPLPNNASVNIDLKLGVMQRGIFRVLVIIEALP